MAASASPPGDQAVPGGFRLGTIQGIEIRVQWSLLVVFASDKIKRVFINEELEVE